MRNTLNATVITLLIFLCSELPLNGSDFKTLILDNSYIIGTENFANFSLPGLLEAKKFSLMANFQNIYESLFTTALGISFPLGKGSFSAYSRYMFSYEAYQETSIFKEFFFGNSYNINILHFFVNNPENYKSKILVGLSSKFVHSYLYPFESFAVAFDLGFGYIDSLPSFLETHDENFIFSLSFNNMGFVLKKYYSQELEIPFGVVIYTKYGFFKSEDYIIHLSFSSRIFEGYQNSENTFLLALNYKNLKSQIFAELLGINLSGLGVSININFETSVLNINISYFYKYNLTLGGLNSYSLGIF